MEIKNFGKHHEGNKVEIYIKAKEFMQQWQKATHKDCFPSSQKSDLIKKTTTTKKKHTLNQATKFTSRGGECQVNVSPARALEDICKIFAKDCL